jgi:hypothetical protein
VLPAIEVFNEGGYQIELVQWASRVARAANAWEGAATPAEKEKILSSLREQAQGFYKDFYLPLDQQMMAAMLRVYQVYLPADQQPDIMQVITTTHQGNLDAYAAQVCRGTNLASLEKFEALLADFSVEKLRQDPAVQLMSSLFDHYYLSAPVYEKLTARIEQLQRVWMQGQLEVLAEKRYYPDANFTLRVAYGQMEGMAPSDAVSYQAYTTLDGVMEKYKPGDAEFDVPARLIELYQRRDYGRYGQNGEMRVAFIASNHTSGGNSGSPVINGEGHLIGINFDRNWEGTMSDINYDIRQCRNISVDIRYVLFIIDKVAGAGYLLEEMKLVE